ncbi:IS5 family transposase [Streptomyces hydrogenans]|uniref:IS5 family transposase n=1 Tax=Streptomyces hydrogenans TaxID=1873719 RepID=UPI00382FC2A1
MGRGDLSDAEWEQLRLLLPVSNGRCGRWRDHRQVIDGILHRVRTGVQWRDLPERFGPWKTVYERHHLWVGRRNLGTPAPAGPGRGRRGRGDRLGHLGRLHRRACTSARRRRPHRSAAGSRLKGGRSSRTPGRDAVTEPRRPPGGGGTEGEGLGRSRGGFTTKIHLSADGRCRPLSLIVTPGQRADCTQFEPVLEKIRVPRIGPGRPRKKPDSLAADRAYSNGPCREYLRRRGIRHTIPEKIDSQAARLRKGSRGGRPPGFDEERYKKRNTVERAINKLKHARAVATRYDKRGYIFLGTATAAAVVIWLRT